MFSRVASTVARATRSSVATGTRRVLSSSGGAAAAASGSSGFVPVSSAARTAGVLAVTAAAGLAAIAVGESEGQGSALCAASGPAKYTGEPGTAYERSFIVSTAACAVWLYLYCRIRMHIAYQVSYQRERICHLFHDAHHIISYKRKRRYGVRCLLLLVHCWCFCSCRVADIWWLSCPTHTCSSLFSHGQS